VAAPPGLAAIEARLDRMEALLQRIAERVGVSDAIIYSSCGGR
jgi:hypothetical protein